MPRCFASLSSSLYMWSFSDCMNLGRGVAPAVSLDIRGILAVRGEKASVTKNPQVKGRLLPTLNGVSVNASLEWEVPIHLASLWSDLLSRALMEAFEGRL